MTSVIIVLERAAGAIARPDYAGRLDRLNQGSSDKGWILGGMELGVGGATWQL